MLRLFANAAFFLSGVAGLTFEILWMRYLGLAMGATTLAVATITGIYMGGLALGSYLGGRLADRQSRPIAAYGIAELGVAMVALTIPGLAQRVPMVDAALFTDALSAWSRGAFRSGVAMALLAVPTVLMGATLPLLARAITATVGDAGRRIGALYTMNIAGAAVGAALTGFWWLPTWGLTTTHTVAVGIDLGLGVVALGAGWRLFPRRPAQNSSQPPTSTSLWRPGTQDLVILLVITGASAMALQVLWTRALGVALGPSTYAFSAIVCAYLLGLASGGGLASRIADRQSAPRLTVALVLVGIAIAALGGTVVVDDLPLMLRGVVLDPQLTAAGLVRSEFALAALTVLPATVGMGMLFPLVVAAVVSRLDRLGETVGQVYAVNTIGAVAGSWGAAFVLLPGAGVEGGLRIASGLYALLALWILRRGDYGVRPGLRQAVAGAAVAVTGACVLWPTWNVGQWTLGLYRVSMTRDYYTDTTVEAPPVVFHADGLTSTVTVEEADGVRWIKVDGKIDGSSEGDMPTQVLSGLLPLVLHPEPQRVAVIGCGSCVTAGAALQPMVKRLDLIEIEPVVIAGAHLFTDVNRAPWDDPRVQVVHDDGRNFMQRTRTAYDVIISEPSNPWMTGAASLFTVEFFEIAARRLKRDGLFLQWLQIYELAPERIASVIKTFQSVFPQLWVFSAHPESNDLLMVGSASPIRLPWNQLNARYHAFQKDMLLAEVNRPEGLLALLLFNHVDVEAHRPTPVLNTDDNGLIEFGAPRDLITFAARDPTPPWVDDHSGARAELVHRLVSGPDELWPTRALALSKAYLEVGMLADAENAAADALEHPETKTRAQEVIELARLLAEPDRVEVLENTQAIADPVYARALSRLRAGDPEGALRHFEKTPKLAARSAHHRLLFGYLLYRSGYLGQARQNWQRLRADYKSRAEEAVIAYYLAKEAYGSGDYARALSEMRIYRDRAKAFLSPAARQD